MAPNQLTSKVPELLTIVSREEISKLFDIFFDNSVYMPIAPDAVS